MDNNKNNREYHQNFQQKVQQMDRHTRYIIFERDTGKGRRKVVSFDERYMQEQSSPTLIEDLIRARNMHIALNRALADLTPEEDEIITECFFEKPESVKLSKVQNGKQDLKTQRPKRCFC